jgi:uncharacterized protein (TIGR02186 family)
MTPGRRLLPAFLLAATLCLAGGQARAAELVADLSNHLVAITTGFAGTDVLLFGAVEQPGEVVVIVRGPNVPIRMHRKSRIAGIWMNTATMSFDSAPSFYAVNASAPLDKVANPAVRERHGMGLENLDIPLPRAKASPNVAQEWRDALVRAKARKGHYARAVGSVTFLGARLFRSNVFFPANVPTGSYTVEVYLLREGRVVSAQTTPLIVSKVGVEAELFDFAYEYSATYGAVAILIALVAGWLAHTLFRKA